MRGLIRKYQLFLMNIRMVVVVVALLKQLSFFYYTHKSSILVVEVVVLFLWLVTVNKDSWYWCLVFRVARLFQIHIHCFQARVS